VRRLRVPGHRKRSHLLRLRQRAHGAHRGTQLRRLRPGAPCRRQMRESDLPLRRPLLTRVWAISMRTGEMRAAITRYKYDGKWGWAAIFGRILVGLLNENRATFGTYDLITPSPSYARVAGPPAPGSGRPGRHGPRVPRATPVTWRRRAATDLGTSTCTPRSGRSDRVAPGGSTCERRSGRAGAPAPRARARYAARRGARRCAARHRAHA
jgi:hypothetical protein